MPERGDPLVVLDADVLGRGRTGDETYVENLLRSLAPIAHGVRLAAVTRRPDLVPAGVEAVELPARSQELRMAWRLPRLLRRLRPALGHFQHALPLGLACPAVVTIHDLSFARDSTLMGPLDRWTFRTMVPRAVRRAERVLAVSERTRRDLVELYGIAEEKIVVTPNGVDPAFSPGSASGSEPRSVTRADVPRSNGAGGSGPRTSPPPYLLYVGAIQARKDPLAAVDAAAEVGLPLVVAGPAKEPALARELRRRGADLRGYLGKEELAQLYRDAACLLFPSRYEGFGLPLLEAMASGTPVVAADEPALREVGGNAALYAGRDEFAAAIRRALADREKLCAAGLERARAFSWDETARRTLAVYRELLGE